LQIFQSIPVDYLMLIRENGHYPARFFKDFMLVAAALQQPRQSNMYTGTNSPWSISEKTGIIYPLLKRLGTTAAAV